MANSSSIIYFFYNLSPIHTTSSSTATLHILQALAAIKTKGGSRQRSGLPAISFCFPLPAHHKLYPVITVLLWGDKEGHSIPFQSYDTAGVEIINKGWTLSLAIMQYIHRLTLVLAQPQLLLRPIHVPGHWNCTAVSFFSEIQILSTCCRSQPNSSSFFIVYHLQLTVHLHDLTITSQNTILNNLTSSQHTFLVGITWNPYM